MGTALSGRQKQRVLLARALYFRPQILLLDEATSHPDMDNEAIIGRAIAALKITRIMSAHRPQTIAMVDRVFRLENGKLVDVGIGSVASASIVEASTNSDAPGRSVALTAFASPLCQYNLRHLPN